MNLMTDVLAAGVATLPAQADVLAGAVLRPPLLAWDGSRYRGAQLRGLDADSLAGCPGVVRLVAERDFVGIVAQSAAFALGARARLRVEWDDSRAALRADTTSPGNDVAAPTGESADGPLARTYRWPAVARPPACGTWAVAWHHGDGVTVWAACESVELLRQELAALLALPTARIEVRGNGLPASPLAFDAAGDAALLSRAVGQPVRIEAHPQGDSDEAQLLTLEVDAQRGPDGRIARFELRSGSCAAARPSLARLLAQGAAAPAAASAAPASPYAFAEQQFSRGTMPLGPWRTVPAEALAADVFATESFMDEAARAAAADPVDFRLAHLGDDRGAALVRQVRQQASQGAGTRQAGARRGTGFGYASALDAATQPPRRTWSAWSIDVAVDSSGHVDIERVVVGHDAEGLRPMSSQAAWIEGQVQDATARLLQAPSFDDWGVAADAPQASGAAQVPAVEVVPPGNALAPYGRLAWSEAATLPAAAALANAVFDATGVRLRQPPFHSPDVQARLADAPGRRGRRRAVSWWGGLAALTAGVLATVAPWRTEIAPVSRPDPGLYSAAAIERGRLVAAAGDCAVCHTAPGGATNAGGLALETPFGTIHSTNITPDEKTGIGNWSYAAFERAMRHGVHRDGHRLYPAFPYTAFAKTSDGDLQALYAYLMAQPAVASQPPRSRLAFPYNVRGLLAGWNLLFHDATPYQADPMRSAEWNRGAYLVQGLGHCGACHTPRNALGAERRGPQAFLAGGDAEGWEAPALNALSKSPVPWTQADLFEYLRTGVSARHGVAAGPMAPVVQELQQLPDSDIRAIASYLGSLGPAPAGATATVDLQSLESRAAREVRPGSNAARLFEGACAACHQAPGGPTLFGSKVSLALNTNLHSDRPDNLVQVILRGVPDPAHPNLGYMPGFADSLDDRQVQQLVHYLRARFAGDKPGWQDVGATIARIRREQAHAQQP
jgi:nicotinate dehydrogenase subunit B